MSLSSISNEMPRKDQTNTAGKQYFTYIKAVFRDTNTLVYKISYRLYDAISRIWNDPHVK